MARLRRSGKNAIAAEAFLQDAMFFALGIAALALCGAYALGLARL
jgi:hypothetical protein